MASLRARTNITNDFLGDTATSWSLPLIPGEVVPKTSNPLAGVDRAALLNASPAMLSLIIRTGANAGLQVKGPEEVSASELLKRVQPVTMQSDFLVVGSVASPDKEWPTYDGKPLPEFHSHEPYKSTTDIMSTRTTTATKSIAPGVSSLSDPVSKGIITAAGVIALQDAQGVMGHTEALREVLEDYWGVERGTFNSFAPYAMGPSGDLLRYAIGLDRLRPVVHMPLQVSNLLSVYTAPMVRTDYGEDVGVNWARLRAVAQAIFHLTKRTEGHDMLTLASSTPPGAPGGDMTRKGILVFQPNYLTMLSCPASTFRVMPSKRVRKSNLQVSGEITSTILAHAEALRLAGPEVVLQRPQAMTRSKVVSISPVPGNVLTAATQTSVRGALMPVSRGRRPNKVVRAHIYSALNSAISPEKHLEAAIATEMIRDMGDMAKRCNFAIPRDTMAYTLARSLSQMAPNIRNHLEAEAGRLGSSLHDWYEEIITVVPESLRPPGESTTGWMLAMAYEILSLNNIKWLHLAQATLATRVKQAMRETLGIAHATVSKAGLDEGLRACNAYVSRSSKVWSMHYEASRTAAYRVSASVEGDTSVTDLSKQQLALPYLKLGGLLWEFRSRAVTTTKFSLCFEEEVPSDAAFVKVACMTRVVCIEFDFHRQWNALIGNMARTKGLPARAVQMIKNANTSGWFDNPMHVFKSNDWVSQSANLVDRPYRYVVEPFTLWTDLADYLEDQARDCAVLMSKALEVEDKEEEKVELDYTAEDAVTQDIRPWIRDMEAEAPKAYTGYRAMSDCPGGFADTLEFLEEEVDASVIDELMSNTYENYDEFEKAVNALIFPEDTYDDIDDLNEANPLG